MSHPIRLTPKEMLLAGIVGVMREVENLKLGRQNAHGLSENDDWWVNIEGALGELAASKFLDVFWSGMFRFRGDDVGTWQVRRASEHWHKLILHKEDPDDKKFILVTGKNGGYQIHGWMLAKHGKQEKWWKDPVGNRPAFFVPQIELRSFT